MTLGTVTGSIRVMAIWDERAEELLEEALAELRDGVDPIPTISAAETAVKIANGELPESELASWFPDPDDLTGCICPPDLVARGGFKGGCPVHRA